MVYLDKCNTKLVNAGEEYVAIDGQEVKCIVPIGSSAIIRAESRNGDDHAVGGLYANAGLTRLPGEMIYGAFSKVTVTTGTCYLYIADKYEGL